MEGGGGGVFGGLLQRHRGSFFVLHQDTSCSLDYEDLTNVHFYMKT